MPKSSANRMPAPGSEAAKSSAGMEAVIAQIQQAFLAKDARIEQLELTNRQLEFENRQLAEQLAAIAGTSSVAQAAPPGPGLREDAAEEWNAALPSAPVATAPETPLTQTAAPAPAAPADPAPATAAPAAAVASPSGASVPIASDYVRMVAPPLGFHRDGWTDAYFSAAFLSERPLAECVLEVWLKPNPEDRPVQLFVKVNDGERHRADLKIGALNTVRFPVSVAARTIFQIDIVCDYVKPEEPPDRRRLSYVLRSLAFS